MKKTLPFVKIVCLLCFFSVSVYSQNVILNNDFEESAGSLNSWQYTTATSLMVDNGDHFASLYGDNGVLYQKITNIIPGLPYVCSINFKSIVAKQTTGFGFAIEKETQLTIPVFTIGATNLRDFCNNNNGQWTTMSGLTGTAETDGSETFSYNITMPADATAIYICIGTKGAVAKLDVNNVILTKDNNTHEVTFLVEDSNNQPVEGAAIEIESFPEPVFTDATGKVSLTLLLNNAYKYSVQKDYFQIYSTTLNVESNTTTVNVALQDLVEVKDVQTKISTYGDNATPYPIYAHLWNSGMDYTFEINKKITSNFDYVIGGGDVSGATNNQNTNFSANNLHAEDSNFQVINYQGGWSEKSALLNNKKADLLYYRCGNLINSIGASDISFAISKPSDNKGLGLVASEPGNFTTWIRIDNELMKLVSVSSKNSYPITVTVERGLDGSIATSHSVNSTVTAPLYTVIPVQNGNNSNLSYFNPVFGPRKENLKQNAINYARNYNHDGIWIDILVGLLGGQNMTGGNYTLWNHSKEEVYTNEAIVYDTKVALNYIYQGFYAQMGYYPTIYGNNVLYDQNYTTSSRGYMMEKTMEFPRALDGFCHENSWGHMSDDTGAIDNDGNPVSTNDIFRVSSKYANGRFLEWYMGNTWINNCKAIALLAQKELPNQPMTINAGFKNQWFAYDLTNEIRYDFNKYCYASYLLSVHVDENKKIASRMGISPMTDDGSGNYDIVVEPFFTYDIGVPTESYDYKNFTNYKVGSNNLYARKFEKGLVLVNPFNTDMSQSVTINSIVGNVDGVYLNPENNNEQVTSIQLKSRESLILVFLENFTNDDDKDGVTNDIDECPNTPPGTNVNDKGCDITLSTKNLDVIHQKLQLYPNPVNDKLTIKLPKTSEINSEKEVIKVYNIQGVVVKNFGVKSSDGTIELNVSELNVGVYFIKIKGIFEPVRFVKL
ncbi:T9SS C-terminal target domain-containing protein [Lutibacter sp. HS1-25]|uniref:T9SS type A sorting domain-containing protein n=1 Tax=Lutibacter sp. HS1-25 TaxID=2485000 RepID=UPI00101361D1|nr:T9SS type A sorting domain-containing protein [Lutibacter sp. HS1-25]RXP62703.1 T9SS C-terminal target domain-containing protein [Lutibacter sp. HS1-25]